MSAEFEVAIVGLIGVFIGALIPSIIQLITTRQMNKISDEQFKSEMKLNYKEYLSKIEQIQKEQKRIAHEKASKEFEAESSRFYTDRIREMQFYDRLVNELHYLNNISHPNQKEERIETGVYPIIPNRLYDMIDDIGLPGNIAMLIGALRGKIDTYNAAVNNSVSSEVLEQLLGRIYGLIKPINEERFENYSKVQAQVRDHEIRSGRMQLKGLDESGFPGDAPTEPLYKEDFTNIENKDADNPAQC